MGKMSVIQNRPGCDVPGQWPHQDGRKCADKERPDHLAFLRETEGVGSLMVADANKVGVKFDGHTACLDRGDMLFWLPWVRHSGLRYPVASEEDRQYRRLHAYFHLRGHSEVDDIAGIHCHEVHAD